MEFTITPNSGQQFSVSSITAQWQRSATGNTEIALRSSADNFAADIDSVKPVADTTSTQSFTWTVSQSASATPVTYRFYSFAEAASGSGGPGDGTGNDIVVSGLVSPSSSTAPTITNISPTSGSVGTSVTITGTNFASNATVSFNGTAATNVTFNSGSSLTAAVPVGASTGPITVTVGSESGTSSGSFTVVDPSAPLITTTGTFTAFSTTAGNASASQSITVNGTNLTASITATAPTGFEVSSDNTNFGPSATIAQSGGSLFARITANGSQGPLSGNISLSSTGASDVLVPVSGNVSVVLQPGIVVISQIYGAGGNSGSVLLNDFVELYNPGSSPVSLENWSIQYSPATGTFGGTNSTTILTGAIASKGHYLIQLAGGTSNPTAPALPTPDALGNANVAANNFKLALVNSSTPLSGSNPLGNPTIIDFVGVGTGNAFEGSAAAPAPNTTLAIFRKSGGEQDTNDNSADFETGDPNPRNSGATPPPAVPTITTSGTLTLFSTTQGASSAAQSFTVNGTNLTANITATAPASFEVSTNNSSFASTTIIPQSGGNASATVFVRLAASAPVGSPSGNITLSSFGASNRLVAVVGNVTSSTPGAPVVTGATFNGTVGQVFSASISATNGPNIFSTSPSLPAGLTLNASTGAITGTPAAAGNSTIVITATNNATLSGNASFTFNIAKGTPTITTPPTATPIRVGQTLSNSTLSGGAASVPGTFAFTTPSTAPVATGNQSVTFTPTDSGNFTTASINVSVTVNPAPTINVNPTSLTGFSTKQNVASANQTLTVNGTNLEGPVTISASSGYEISTNGANYSTSLPLAPAQAGAPVTRSTTIIASDTASNYGIAGNHTWGNGTNGGSGFQPWLFNVVTNDGGTPPPAFYAGAFVGDPVTAQLTNFPAPAFGLYANPGGTAASATVSRAFSQPLAVGDSFSFQWATNWDSDVGNKGFNIFAGGNQVVNVNQGGFPGVITLNGQTAIDGTSGYGTQPMTWTFTRTTATNLQVTTTDRKGGSAVAFSTNITISAAPEGFSFYTSAMGQGDQRQPYFNNLRITSSGTSIGGNLTNTTLYVRLAANGTPGAANGNLTLTSANATTRTVALSGTVVALVPPVITSRTINGTVGSNLTASINATNSPTSHTANGTLPPAVTFNATTGVFSGTPTTAGNYVVAVTATNIDGTGSGNLTFAIAKGTPTIITPPTASLIYSGQQLSVSTLTGGVASIPGNFSFTNPSLIPPVGNATQNVTFTPADTANWNNLTLNVPVQVSPDPPGPPGVSDATFAGSVGANLTVSINATNGPISHNATTALPPGLSLDSVTGAITGIPQVVGNYTVSVTATNIKGTGSGNITFVIGKGTPTVLTAPTARVYTDETLGTAYSPLSGQMNTVGNFAFVDPSLSFPNSANTTQTVSVLFTPVDLVNWIATTVNATVAVDALPDNGPLTLTAQVTQLREGDEYSESRIRIRRPGPLSSNATINVSELPSGQLQGDIIGDVNFLNLPSQVTIPAGSNSTVFYVIAKNDTAYTGNRSVVLSVTSRFHGPTAQSVTLNIIEDETSPAPGFASWSNNATRTPALIRDYAIGGAAMGEQGEIPSLSMNSTYVALDAVIRTQDPNLSVLGEWTADLKNGPWTPVNLSLHSSQTGLNPGFQRQFFSVPIQNGETRKFLRVRVELLE